MVTTPALLFVVSATLKHLNTIHIRNNIHTEMVKFHEIIQPKNKSRPGVHQMITSETMGAPKRQQNFKNKKWISLQNKKYTTRHSHSMRSTKTFIIRLGKHQHVSAQAAFIRVNRGNTLTKACLGWYTLVFFNMQPCNGKMHCNGIHF